MRNGAGTSPPSYVPSRGLEAAREEMRRALASLEKRSAKNRHVAGPEESEAVEVGAHADSDQFH